MTAAPLAIIGIGCLFPKADGLGAYWANIKNRVDCITETPPTHWRPEEYLHPDPKAPDRVYVARGGFLVNQFQQDRLGYVRNSVISSRR